MQPDAVDGCGCWADAAVGSLSGCLQRGADSWWELSIGGGLMLPEMLELGVRVVVVSME